MLGGDSFLGSPKVRTFLVGLFGFIFYLYLVRGSGQINDLQIAGDYAYLAVGSHGLRVVNVSDVERPVEVSAFDTLGSANGLFIRDGLVYLADGDEGLRVFNVEDPAHPREVGGVITPGDAQDVFVEGKYAYVADGGAGLTILEPGGQPSIGACHPAGTNLSPPRRGHQSYRAGKFRLPGQPHEPAHRQYLPATPA